MREKVGQKSYGPRPDQFWVVLRSVLRQWEEGFQGGVEVGLGLDESETSAEGVNGGPHPQEGSEVVYIP